MKMPRRSRLGLVALAIALAPALRAADLAADFAHPPESARIWVWWHWVRHNVSPETLTADLEAFKAQGVGGVTIYPIDGAAGAMPAGPRLLTPAWLALYRHAVSECRRLGLGVSLNLASGWDCGGPWVLPEDACKHLVHAELAVDGPQALALKLPQPETARRKYFDLDLQAFPAAAAAAPRPVATASSQQPPYPPANAVDGDDGTFWVSSGVDPGQAPTPEHPEWLCLDFGQPHPGASLTLRPHRPYGPKRFDLQVSDDARTWTTLQTVEMPERDEFTVRFAEHTARYWRLWITASWTSQNCQIVELAIGQSPRLGAQLAIKGAQQSPPGRTLRERCAATAAPLAADGAEVVEGAKVIDLRAKVDADGVLHWDAPPGHWVILRTGCAPSGNGVKCAGPGGAGAEVDPLRAEAMDHHFERMAGTLLDAIGPDAGQTVHWLQVDSWEIGLTNASQTVLDEFAARRGYDPRPFLAALAGRIVDSPDVTERFLYDYRRTLGDVIADNYFGRLTTLCHQRGCANHSEAGGPCAPEQMPMDCLANLGRCDVPMGEFWQDGGWTEAGQNLNGKQTATAAHVYGHPLVAAEAFTSMWQWPDSPRTLKPTADRAFCEGTNWFFVHQSSTTSPNDGLPGNEFFAGTHFDRRLTWWPEARGFTDYLARCQLLLRQGRFVADVLYYNGDGCPCYVEPKHVDPGLGPGYDYDVCGTEALLTRLAVRDHQLMVPDGPSYDLLVLPPDRALPLAVVKRLADLATAGATILGPPPEREPGLRNYPAGDAEVAAAAQRLWGSDRQPAGERKVGEGRVIWGRTPRQVLAGDGRGPDFEVGGGQPGAFVDFIHRRTDEAEIYFLANRREREEAFEARFRVAGRQPELWDAVSGAGREAEAFSTDGQVTQLPLTLPPHGSLFVVFRRPADPARPAAPAAEPRVLADLDGPWTVAFDPEWLAPTPAPGATLTFAGLDDWARRPEDGVKHFSGTATYRRGFTLAAVPRRLWLDLGTVRELARVRLNGQDLGLVWCAPWRVELTAAAVAGDNKLEIEVTNLWPNRLIGDAALPAAQRLTRTNVAFRADQPLLPSGLLGPVRLWAQD
jgi:hypothetical protein